MFRCKVCEARQEEITFLRKKVDELQDRLMSMCGSLANYAPHDQNRDSSNHIQTYIDPDSGKVYQYNEKFAMYEEVKDNVIIDQIRKQQSSVESASEQVEKAEKEWSDQYEQFKAESVVEVEKRLKEELEKLAAIRKEEQKEEEEEVLDAVHGH